MISICSLVHWLRNKSNLMRILWRFGSVPGRKISPFLQPPLWLYLRIFPSDITYSVLFGRTSYLSSQSRRISHGNIISFQVFEFTKYNWGCRHYHVMYYYILLSWITDLGRAECAVIFCIYKFFAGVLWGIDSDLSGIFSQLLYCELLLNSAKNGKRTSDRASYENKILYL